ncbi:DNA cytosine methyltransferase [Cuspidothrix issatschenkoi]|jgi:DNA (cytosine-5)-methyltransferase 1|uniref:DNA (cytosine-5-)-methyltransferase n=1 Tax=Cuspidothrix issatschenkoi CHARLIE-1 TaxID=2052836 RepID=A0A2S6CSI1_9CYAN|nr:DNA cytosine methyltransferase [Cuspidothrix issatschenkoi]PPJ62661.1 DNA (cytosine-5-)-methyltransferase [Cuspidothrix issatschenkoi CHARLIE-1]
MIHFIDLFAGIGGMRLGFQQACNVLGIESQCVFSSEIDKKAIETYKLNFNDQPTGDIREIDTIPAFDFMLAGFPCQSFSYAGKQKGFGDTRGTLFWEIERLLKNYQPQAFLLENVRGLTTHDQGRTFKTIINSLEKIGYGIHYLLLNSSNFGVPQNRVRIYIIGLLGKKPKITLNSDRGATDSHTFKEQLYQVSLFENTYSIVKVKDIIEEKVSRNYYLSKEFEKQLFDAVDGQFEKLHGFRLIDFRGGNSLHSWDLGIKGKCTKDERDFMAALISHRRHKEFGDHQDGKSLTIEQIKTFFDHENIENIIYSLMKKKYLKEINGKYNPVSGNMSFEVFKFLDPESISITLTSSDANKLGIVQDRQPRRITPRECARLQGFPDSYILHPNDNAAYKQFGNAVTVPVIQAIVEDFFQNNSITKTNLLSPVISMIR